MRHAVTFTPLMRASAFGNLEAVREFLEEGYDVNQRGPRNSTALMFAASSGHLDVVRELVERGADIHAAEDGGWDALRHAAEDGHKEIVSFLEKVRRIRDEVKRG